MNLFGLVLGLSTLLIIGLGAAWVIRCERYFGVLWWPYVLELGAIIILGSLLVKPNLGSALLGIAGASVVWGAMELKEQAVRTELGWYEFHEEKIEPPFADMIRKWRAPHL
jgi:hypothetical protein